MGTTKIECNFSILPRSYGLSDPCPDVLTEEEAIRFLRLDVDGPFRPERSLQYYRERGLLHGAKIGKRLRYSKKELLAFVERASESRQKKSEDLPGE